MARSDTSFKKGKSGNPGGRPKTAPNFREKCRELSIRALRALEEVIKDKSAANRQARVAASRVVIEHAYGKPPQTIENIGPERDSQAAIDAVQAILHPEGVEKPKAPVPPDDPDPALAAQLERAPKPKGNGKDKAKPKEAEPKRKFSGGGMATEY